MQFDASTDESTALTGDDAIVREAHENYLATEDWQGVQDERIREDIKFANADDRNAWQWPEKIYQQRTGKGNDGVALTINNVRIHNNLIINSMCKSNYGVVIRPTGGKATYEAAKVMQSIIRRIEYISKFSAARRKITEHQVDGGIGYCLIETKYVSHRSHNQDIYLRSPRDPTGVRLDPYIKEPDGSDATFGFVFERMARKAFGRRYPKWKDKVGTSPIDSAFVQWISDKEIMLAKYYRKKDKPDTLVAYKLPSGDWIEKLASEIKEESGDDIYDQLISDIKDGTLDGKTRKVTDNDVEWFLIAGDKIIERGKWAGKYIPICRCVGQELVIDATLDLKGMTRQLISAQRMLNYSASMSVEDVAMQPRATVLASSRSMEGQEQFKEVNTKYFTALMYNDIDDEAPAELQKIDAPTFIPRPQPSTGHQANMESAERWIMMGSGQFQAQMGENDTQSAASGKAIGERQQQGDTATYHFPEHQSDMLRFIGVQLLDLIPKIYDTERTLHIIDDKNEKRWIKIDPNQTDAIQEMKKNQADDEAVALAFNPSVGEYECVSDPGPDYATQRQDAWNAISMLMTSNKEIASSCADLLFKYGDFPGADELMERLQKEIKAAKPYLFDDAIEPQMLALQQQMQRLTALNAELMTKLADANLKIRGREQLRDIEAFNADTRRADSETKRNDVMLKFIMANVLSPAQRAQMQHELDAMGHQHIYDMIQQANAPQVSNTNGSGQ